ncbi:MAG: hypothetical protein ABIP30_13675 [Ferruginibacter sp.]
MIAMISLIFFSLLILILGLFEVPLPFIYHPKKNKRINVPFSPFKRQGIISGKNIENEKAHLRFIKKHINNFVLVK